MCLPVNECSNLAMSQGSHVASLDLSDMYDSRTAIDRSIVLLKQKRLNFGTLRRSDLGEKMFDLIGALRSATALKELYIDGNVRFAFLSLTLRCARVSVE